MSCSRCRYQHDPPGIAFMGKKTWAPGKNLQRFIAATFGIQPKEQGQIVEAVSDAVSDVGAQVFFPLTAMASFTWCPDNLFLPSLIMQRSIL